MNRFSHRYKMVSAKDDSLPTNTEVYEADADEPATPHDNGLDTDIRSTRSRILAVFDRRTYDVFLLVLSIPQLY